MMKKNYFYIAFIVLLTGCNPMTEGDINPYQFNDSTTTSKSEEFNVSADDVKRFISLTSKIQTKATEMEIQPLVSNADTIMYLVSYADGWEIISADRRTPIVLAYAEKGKFDVNENPALTVWLDQIGEDISNVKRFGDENTNLQYVEQWNAFSVNTTNSLSTKSGDGYWEVIKLEPLPNQIFTSPQLTTTKWTQHSPWNNCVPFTKDFSEKCVAGCVSVAGAQMLYFLNRKLGVPKDMFTEGSCVGYSHSTSDRSYQFSFSVSSASAWNAMAQTGSTSTAATKQSAILIGYIGQLLGTNYTKNGSDASTSDLKPVFDGLGISSTYSDFDDGASLQSVKNGMPVVVRADGNRDGILFGLFHKYTDGHAWIIDGYREVVYSTKRTFRWVNTGPDNPYEYDENGNIIGGETYMTDIVKTTSLLFRMNWGWRGDFNDQFFAFGGDWLVVGEDGDYHFNYRRKMLHNFAKK